MKRSRFSEEQIVGILKEAEAGGTVKELCRRHGIAGATKTAKPNLTECAGKRAKTIFAWSSFGDYFTSGL